jgi:tetrachlorobenzoquinone reductase
LAESLDLLAEDLGTSMRLRVDAVARAASGVVLLTFVDPVGHELPAWEPGAHLELVLPSGLTRQYSLCGRAEDRHTYTVAVQRDDAGRGGSREIHATGLVDRILEVRGPRNRFKLIDAPSYLLLAGGIGITPLSAMARRLAAVGARWQLIYGGRSRSSMAFLAELEELAADRLSVVAEDESGRPDLAAAVLRAPTGTAVYCCGPEPMLRIVEELCAERGTDVSLHFERFAPSGRVVAAGATGDQPFEIELRRRHLVLVVPAHRSALDVVREVVPNHPYSCREGECGSCEVRVLEGKVEHRDEVLSDEERESNEVMMLCVSRALSDRLVIDL